MEDKRDWQADMELVHIARYEYNLEHLNGVLDALFYWLQYAEKWKAPYDVTCKLLENSRARADQAEQNLATYMIGFDLKNKQFIKREHLLFDSELREQKLKEAMEIAIRDGGKYENPYESLVYLQSFLSTIYPSIGDKEATE